tara:strand:+ start:3904 stop:5190 length:1287 start_codon:yes stop_codon:yes gene_type:complete
MMKNVIGIIGLGYVGLPLGVAFGKKFRTIGFDIDQKRVNDLKKLFDKTNEIESKELEYVLNENVIENDLNGFYPTSKLGDLKVANIYIITVPTPVTKNKKPDFKPLFNASRSVGEIISKNDIVIYESTVYPGATEDECVPIIEKTSGLKYNLDFFVGYSPERINPGDKQRTLEKIIKVTSGSNAETAIKVDNLYKEIIAAGTYLAPNIKTAEAAKVIENSQRDINIAFVNELAKIFSLMDLDTNEVLDAASSKWNFLNFKPGLVGGHCIGVDPYYIAQKSISLGYNPEIILAGRKINDSMSSFVSNEVLRLMQSKNININNSNVLIMGVTFKENCPDFRNTKVVDLYFQLISKVKNIDIYDPLVDKVSFKKEYKINIMGEIMKKKYELIILAVPHKEFENINLKLILKRKSVVYDIKNFLKMTVDGRL